MQFSRRRPSRPRRREQAWFEHPWLARVLQLRYPGERPACGQRVGGGYVPACSRLSGVVVQFWGGSVIFGALTGELACSAVLAHVVGRRGARAARACGGAVAQQVGSFVGSCVVEVYSKKFDYQSGRPDLNRRPLDPQSRSGRRWAWLSVAPWALDQSRQSPGVAGCRLKSAHVGSWNGSSWARRSGRWSNACRVFEPPCARARVPSRPVDLEAVVQVPTPSSASQRGGQHAGW